MDYEQLLKDPPRLRAHVAERLAEASPDFAGRMERIRAERRRGAKSAASGVLVPLEFDASSAQCVVVLNKRSPWVRQPGDLCCPGGGTEQGLDRCLGRLLSFPLLPFPPRSEPFRRLLRSPPRQREVLLLILAGVLRESWEEMRLPPWKVEYLGALPVQRMQSFPLSIFPVVGWIRAAWRARPNREVAEVLRLPLRAFFEGERYALCRFRLEEAGKEGGAGGGCWEMPCLIVEGSGGREEVLWGATFKILTAFMKRVFGLAWETFAPSRVVSRSIPPYYFTGMPRKAGGGPPGPGRPPEAELRGRGAR